MGRYVDKSGGNSVILSTILLILIILIIAILLLFLFYILFPSIHGNNKIKEDAVIADSEIDYIKPEKSKLEKSDVKALVLCSCEKSFEMKRQSFNESYSCALVNQYSGTGTPCEYACAFHTQRSVRETICSTYILLSLCMPLVFDQIKGVCRH